MKKGYKTQILTQSVAFAVNLIMGILKLYLGIVANSITIISDGYNNVGDALGSGCGIVGFAVSNKKPTEKHPHGFGRIEEIISLLLNIIFIIVGFTFVYNSLERFFLRAPINFSWRSFAILAATIPVKILLGVYYHFVNKKYPSDILKVNRYDSIQDCVITSVTLVAYGVSALGTMPIDSILGIVIGGYILVCGIKQFVGLLSKLLGRNEEKEIRKILEQFELEPTFLNVHSYGKRKEVYVALRNDPTEEVIEALKLQNIHLILISEVN